MDVIKKDGNFMGLPMNIARGNPIPLDNSEIWYNLDELKLYAKENPVAYVGQILGLVDEEHQTSTAYIILNCQGDVQEVGKAILVDNSTIVIEDEVLSLKDFGKYFYKYVEASGDEENNNYVAAHYVKQIVDENNPWKAGLEPKVIEDNGIMTLGWYEPNPTTMEGVNAALTGLQNTVDNLTIANNTLATRLDNTYTKAETEAAIAAAPHLKRKKVNKVEDINPFASDAESYIYMVPVGLTEGDNKYYEFIVIDGTLEPVGNWEVNLDDYITKDDANNNFVKAEEGKELIASADLAKLSNIQENAEKNIINSVDNSFSISSDGNRTLSLVSVPSGVNLTNNTSLLGLFVQKETDKSLIANSDLLKLTKMSGLVFLFLQKLNLVKFIQLFLKLLVKQKNQQIRFIIHYML